MCQKLQENKCFTFWLGNRRAELCRMSALDAQWKAGAWGCFLLGRQRCCFEFNTHPGLVSPQQGHPSGRRPVCGEADYILRGILIKQCVLQRAACRSRASESPGYGLRTWGRGRGAWESACVKSPAGPRVYSCLPFSLCRRLSGNVWLEIQTRVLSGKRMETGIWHTT